MKQHAYLYFLLTFILGGVVGALVFGAFAPRKAAGFAAPSLRRMISGLQMRSVKPP